MKGKGIFISKVIQVLSFVFFLFSLSSCYMIQNLKQEKCPIESCHVRYEHFHEEFEFRSRVRPWWKRNQNPKIGQDWKAEKDHRRDKIRRN